MSKLIDIGANLTNFRFAKCLPEVLKAATENNVERIIITGTDVKNSILANGIVEKYKDDKKNKVMLYSTAGIHPHDANMFNDQSIKQLEALFKNKTVVAVGECGLDYNRMFSAKDKQLKCFEEQIKLAIKLNKPLFLHERDAFDDFVKILKKYKGQVRGVVHCFSGNGKHLDAYINLGMYIGITGWVCDDGRNADLLKALKNLPLDKLMIETDAPFLNPTSKGDNVPANVKYVAERLAKELNIEYNELCKTVYENTVTFFSL
jgi:TatD DNase family protein